MFPSTAFVQENSRRDSMSGEVRQLRRHELLPRVARMLETPDDGPEIYRCRQGAAKDV